METTKNTAQKKLESEAPMGDMVDCELEKQADKLKTLYTSKVSSLNVPTEKTQAMTTSTLGSKNSSVKDPIAKKPSDVKPTLKSKLQSKPACKLNLQLPSTTSSQARTETRKPISFWSTQDYSKSLCLKQQSKEASIAEKIQPSNMNTETVAPAPLKGILKKNSPCLDSAEKLYTMEEESEIEGPIPSYVLKEAIVVEPIESSDQINKHISAEESGNLELSEINQHFSTNAESGDTGTSTEFKESANSSEQKLVPEELKKVIFISDETSETIEWNNAIIAKLSTIPLDFFKKSSYEELQQILTTPKSEGSDIVEEGNDAACTTTDDLEPSHTAENTNEVILTQESVTLDSSSEVDVNDVICKKQFE